MLELLLPVVVDGMREEREREEEREKKRSEYYGSSENICQFRRYTRFRSANQRKKIAITSAIKREKQAKREEIRAISSRRSFSSRTTKKRVYITTCYPTRQSFSTSTN